MKEIEAEIPSKKIIWQESLDSFSHVKDKLGKTIDEGIFETVVILNLLGVHTTASCEGHLHWGTRAPWVDVGATQSEELLTWDREASEAFQEAQKQNELHQLSQEEILRLFDDARELQRRVNRVHLEMQRKALEYLTMFYAQRVVPFDRRLTIQGFAKRGRIQSQGAHFQDAAPLGSREQKLQEYRDEMKDFTEFLKHIYFSE